MLPSSPAPTASPRLLYSTLVVLLVLAYFVLFYRLGSAPIQLWDEARLAVNAAEMLARRKWLVTYFGGQPDLWNTKPPLMIWLQALSIKALGYSQLAVRLPAALAALATVLLVFRFGYRQLGELVAGWVGALALLSTSGFVTYHVARTGDYDALLVCWLTLGTLSFFSYLTTPRPARGLLAAAAFTLAVLTKGVAGALSLPALLLWVVLTGRLRWLLGRREFYVGVGLFGLVVGGYYWAREAAAPGYLTAVAANELGGRALQVLDKHGAAWDYYISNLITSKFTVWLGVAVVGLLLGLRQPRATPAHQFCLLVSLLVSWHLLVISVVQTKLPWYDAPIYPLLALLAGLGASQLYGLVQRQYFARASWWAPVAAGLLVAWPAYQALSHQLDAQHDQRFANPHLQFGRYLTQQIPQHPEITKYTVLETDGYNASLEWYRWALQNRYYQTIEVRYGADTVGLQAGQLVVVSDPALRRRLRTSYAAQVVAQQDSCATLRLGTRYQAGR